MASRIPLVRQAIDHARHPALFVVDTISSLASIDYRHDEWSVDVTVGASQKGLMLPPGLSFNALSEKALAAHAHATLPRAFWDWHAVLAANEKGFFPYTPATNLLYGLREALAMLRDEGLPNVFARHARHAEATRRAVRAWGLEILCKNPDEYSGSITAVMTPSGHDADSLRAVVLDRFDLSLGVGLAKLAPPACPERVRGGDGGRRPRYCSGLPACSSMRAPVRSKLSSTASPTSAGSACWSARPRRCPVRPRPDPPGRCRR